MAMARPAKVQPANSKATAGTAKALTEPLNAPKSAGKGDPTITNVGEKTIEIIDSNYDDKTMRVQMCEHLHDKKHLASVSRIMKAGHKVVFDADSGSYMQHKNIGEKTWFREEGGVFYMDLWVKPKDNINAEGFQRLGM